MRDKSGNSTLQVTVMNDRPQGGSADLSEKATIELMQNRRTLYDDSLGLDEPLNETSSNGHGIKVTARYQMHIFDFKKGGSMQRSNQANKMQSLQFYFAESFDQGKKHAESKDAAKSTKDLRFSDDLIVRLFPLAKNHLELRLENLADKFDQGAKTAKIELKKYVEKLYATMN